MTKSIQSDLISTLPDPILHRILGLLLLKQAAQTSVLSKRWEHLWTFLPSLRIDYVDFVVNLTGDEYDEWHFRLETNRERFVEFVNKLLQKQESLGLDVFHLSLSGFLDYANHSDELLEHAHLRREWIHYAVKHNTRVLDLFLELVDLLPPSMYTCQYLEELYLFYCQINVPEIVNLPNLRKLYIYNVEGDNNFLHKLLSGSTILEYLSVQACSCDEYLIAHEFLKHLSVSIFHEARLLVGAPKLLSFSYSGKLPLSLKETLSMPSLVSADIGIHDLQMTEICKKLAPFLGALANVKHLKLQVRCFRCECYVERGAITNESANASSMIEAFPCKNLEIVEIKYRGSSQTVGRLVDVLIASTKESANLKITLSKF